MKVGIFGGTFDPVHVGHLIMAEHCQEQARLDHVWFVPAARPPHKAEAELTPFPRRVEMLELALAGNPAFQIDQLEKDRPGPSFTVDTLESLHGAHPEAELHWIMGSDSLYDLPSWRSPDRVVELAGLLIVARPAWTVWPVEQLRTALHLPAEASVGMQVVHTPLIEISSRDLRRRVAERRSIRYMVPRAVECYIDTHRLYQEGAGH
jgi:nicotinate-nucleotide adenylyltransferase